MFSIRSKLRNSSNGHIQFYLSNKYMYKILYKQILYKITYN